MDNSKKISKEFFEAIVKSKKKKNGLTNMTSIRKQTKFQFHWLKSRSKYVEYLKDE